MEHLWSPWRLAYITGAAQSTGCVFCAAQTDPEAEPLVLFPPELRADGVDELGDETVAQLSHRF